MPTLRSTAADFLKREDGTTAILFGLSFFVLIFAVGFGIDIGRAYHATNKTASAVDAAALAAAKAMREKNASDGEITQIAQEFFDANIVKAGAGAAEMGQIQVNINREAGTIEVIAPGRVPTAFARIAGPQFEYLNFTRSATATFSLVDVELGLMLDVTGSMSVLNKMADMKSAVATLANIMLPDGGNPGKTRIGLAPFSASVNLGSYAAIASNNRSTDGCVIERLDAAARFTDLPPTAAPFGVRGDMNTVSNYRCPNAQVLPLTDNRSAIINTVNSYAPAGCTGGHMGATWAWNLIAPTWSGVWPAASRPAPYRDGKTLKAVVLMTDGLFNTAHVAGGSNCIDGNPVSPQQARQVCDAMKAKGIMIYTVGFRLHDAGPGAAATLQYCASSPGHFINAENGQQLRDAFANIAIQLNNLRLSK